MSKQQEAPGALERVRAFVNTVDFEEGTEALGSPEALATWLSDNRLASPETHAFSSDLKHAIDVREALRALLVAHNGGGLPPATASGTLDAAARRAHVRLRFAPEASATLEPTAAGVDGGLGRLLAIVHDAIADGTWFRLKACREPTCQWAFYDHTKNRSGAWCTMQVCGNRAKARAYRERRATS